jgi:hypothetical protein
MLAVSEKGFARFTPMGRKEGDMQVVSAEGPYLGQLSAHAFALLVVLGSSTPTSGQSTTQFQMLMNIPW